MKVKMVFVPSNPKSHPFNFMKHSFSFIENLKPAFLLLDNITEFEKASSN